ncbi:MAG TPA: inositol monophosphatase family protein [Pelagibacterium sp.]|uniref:inositol monophosphatase family protein n=1 Tax=Pelagibacterium sp. TaxID=1967288 RepID=UPI002C97B409|nr:inositol monophosphatase family protein [Pelagibacterium sp.]HWJ88352.1 inositol monophosphatase family protein [Pelagibacterium sp.]
MNIERLTAILREAAAAEIMPRFRRLDEGDIRTKSHIHDLVTDADEQAERAITTAIKAASPHMVVIGEEAVSANPRLLDTDFGNDTVIYVDPVDGTWNFAAGLPLFAVMAAVVQRGEVVSGVIYDPVGDDWVMTERGCGCFQVFPDGRMVRQHFAEPVSVDQMVGTASTAYIPSAKRAEVLGNMAKVHIMASYRCAGHEYRLGAGGHLDFLMYNKLTPWDHAAGSLMMAESGAHVAHLDGTTYRPAHLEGGLLVASDIESWDALRREVFTI